jgi:hypothetical protein
MGSGMARSFCVMVYVVCPDGQIDVFHADLSSWLCTVCSILELDA